MRRFYFRPQIGAPQSEHFPAKWEPVRRRKCDQGKLEHFPAKREPVRRRKRDHSRATRPGAAASRQLFPFSFLKTFGPKLLTRNNSPRAGETPGAIARIC